MLFNATCVVHASREAIPFARDAAPRHWAEGASARGSQLFGRPFRRDESGVEYSSTGLDLRSRSDT